MCGIVGIFNINKKPVSSLLLKKMTDSVSHRGPDGEGQYIDGFIGLGHRRLAIIDLSSAGFQPMASSCGNFILTFNGEIYNFEKLRKELESNGHYFFTRTDTEVVLHSYMEWGGACIERFNGMFALALWDKRKSSLFLARDRYGIKPLYYAFNGSSFLFASEQKAILKDNFFTKEFDHEALLEYFTFQNIFTNKTFLKNIKLFPAGCSTIISLQSLASNISFSRYWDFDFSEPEVLYSEEEYIEELDRLFCQAVKRQLISDVDVGAYLSGGIDSGSITAIAAKHLPYMKTFTCGFDLNSASGLELGFDEREKAEYMSYLFKTEHYEMVLKAGDMERVMPRLAWHIEEPRVGQSYPNFYAAQLASKFVKVVLSGAGGDELFGGYPWRYYRAADCADFDDYINRYYIYWQRIVPNSMLKNFFKPVWNRMKDICTKDIFKNVFQKVTKASTIEEHFNQSLYFEAKTFLHGLLLVEDKISSAHGLETRVPFLDNDLVDFAMKLPIKHKIKNIHKMITINENEPGDKPNKYFQKTNDGKVLLRKTMNKYIPSIITLGQKQGFSAPDASWFRGESIEYVKRKLLSKNAKIYDYIDRDEMYKMISKHLNGEKNKRLLVWSLLAFEHYLNNDYLV